MGPTIDDAQHVRFRKAGKAKGFKSSSNYTNARKQASGFAILQRGPWRQEEKRGLRQDRISRRVMKKGDKSADTDGEERMR